jgi:hypothetical protein
MLEDANEEVGFKDMGLSGYRDQAGVSLNKI